MPPNTITTATACIIVNALANKRNEMRRVTAFLQDVTVIATKLPKIVIIGSTKSSPTYPHAANIFLKSATKRAGR